MMIDIVMQLCDFNTIAFLITKVFFPATARPKDYTDKYEQTKPEALMFGKITSCRVVSCWTGHGWYNYFSYDLKAFVAANECRQ